MHSDSVRTLVEAENSGVDQLIIWGMCPRHTCSGENAFHTYTGQKWKDCKELILQLKGFHCTHRHDSVLYTDFNLIYYIKTNFSDHKTNVDH